MSDTEPNEAQQPDLDEIGNVHDEMGGTGVVEQSEPSGDSYEERDENEGGAA